VTSKQLQSVLNKLWTTQHICKKFEVSAMTVGAWRARGLPHIVVKGSERPSIRFIKKEAASWIKLHTKHG